MKRLAAKGATTAILFLLITATVLVIGSSPAHASAVSLTGKYIIAFLACDTSVNTCSNPQHHTTYLAESNDSVSWVPVPGFKPYPGSVPDAIRRGNTVYLYNPGFVTRFHLDTGMQSQPVQASLKFANGTSGTFVDPSVYLDSGGVLHLFYLPGITGGDPAQCPSGQSTCTKYILSATEVAGSDGGSFIIDTGVRASYTINQCCFSDPAVFQGPGGYYLYVSEGQSVLAYQSNALAGSYAFVQGLTGGFLVSQGTGGVPSGYYDNASQSFWTFVSHGTTVETIERASTSNINSQIASSAFSAVISGCTFQGLACSYTVGSPAIHLNTPGPSVSSTTTSSSSTAATSSTSSTTTSIGSTSASPTSQTTSTSSITKSTTPVATTTIPTTTITTPTATTTTASRSQSTPATQSTQQTSSSPGPGGGIPEFPYQAFAVTVLSVLFIASYFAFRKQWLCRSDVRTA